MAPPTPDARPPDGPGPPAIEAILDNARNRKHLGRRLEAAGDRVETDLLGTLIRHTPALEALREGPKDRRELEAALDVSRATSHRMTRWLAEQGYVEKADGRFRLTGHGEMIADETLRFEANVRTARELEPLLDVICEDHQEFVLEPFVDATVTVATPEDPYSPVERFLSLAGASETFRGFNTTHMAPLAIGQFHEQVFEATDTEIIYLPGAVEKLVESYPDAATEAVESGHLTLRTRDDLPYGLALFDDRVGIGGYDAETGQMRVFVDTDGPIARQWADRVYRAVKADSDPVVQE